MGVSLGMPISTGGQIVFNALMAAAVLGEWTTIKMWIFGTLAVLLVLVGATLTSLPDKSAPKTSNQNFSWKSGIVAMLISTFWVRFIFCISKFVGQDWFHYSDALLLAIFYA